jgi:phage terminase small subunit
MAELKNPKQEQFCREYVIDFNASEAAKRAGYAARSAGQQAHALLKKHEIQSRLGELVQERRERARVDGDYVVQRLLQIADFDVRELFTDSGALKPASEWPDGAAAAVSGLDVQELHEDHGEGRQPIGDVKKVRTRDTLKALELLGKHLKMFTDKVEHSADEGLIEAIKRGRERANRGES